MVNLFHFHFMKMPIILLFKKIAIENNTVRILHGGLFSAVKNGCPRIPANYLVITFERHRGWFFWSYRIETTPEWCFRECVERGWLPSRFQ